MNKEYLDLILNLRNTCKRNYAVILKRKYPYILEWINKNTPLLNSDRYNLSTKIYWILHDITEFPRCPVCGKEMHKNVDTFERGYFRACSKQCAASSPMRKEKIENTMLNKYGVKSFLETDKSKNALHEWCKERNVINPFQDEEVKHKAALSRLAHFGYEYTMQSPEKRKLASDNYKMKTGYSHQFYDPNVKSKIVSSIQAKIDNGIDIRKKFKDTLKRKRYDSLFTSEIIPLFSYDKFALTDIHTQYTTEFTWKCNVCQGEFKGFLDQNALTRYGYPCRCLTCHPIANGESKPEYEIAEKLISYGYDIIMHDRKQIYPLELDIFCPTQKFAIEFDGLYWHSTLAGEVSKYYHYNKTTSCNKRGISLLHVFEDEYLEHPEIVLNTIKRQFTTIVDYEFEICKIDKQFLIDFMHNNSVKITYNVNVLSYGIMIDNDIKCVCTFSRDHRKYDAWNLIDIIYSGEVYYSKSEILIVDYFAKLNRCTSISYAYDKHFSFENHLLENGFVIKAFVEPKSWFISNRKRYANNLKGIVCGKMWDCGYDVLVKTYN